MRRGGDHDASGLPAVVFRHEDGLAQGLTSSEVAHLVGAAAQGLRRLGVKRGDRVAAFLPNSPEAVIGLLATAAVHAVWSTCSPDLGVRAVVGRFREVEPKVLLAVEGHKYGGRGYDLSRSSEVIGGPESRTPCWSRTLTIPLASTGSVPSSRGTSSSRTREA